ncbi:MAG: PIN domain-containing protein [Planctomycetota bacterium]
MAARRSVLLDTGPLVALLWRGDAAHEGCLRVFDDLEGDVLTTEAVITEAMYLLGRFPGGPDACLEFVLRGGAVPLPMSVGMWTATRRLMLKYRDLPMDFADATLVALAEETGVLDVFTLDLRDFGLYRASHGKRFTVIPIE